jgi:hypothetical protein
VCYEFSDQELSVLLALRKVNLPRTSEQTRSVNIFAVRRAGTVSLNGQLSIFNHTCPKIYGTFRNLANQEKLIRKFQRFSSVA